VCYDSIRTLALRCIDSDCSCLAGVRKQFFLQVRQIIRTTDIRVGSWPKFSTTYEYALPVPAEKLEKIAAKHGEWEGLAELLNTEGRYGNGEPDTKAIRRAFDRALAADPNSRAVHARFLPLRLRQIDYYRSEERALDEKQGRKPGPYPAGISEKQAQSALDWVLSGQKLDPQNSYYDYVLALIYLGLHKDDEVVAAINAGSRKPVFDTYRKDASLNARQLLIHAGVPGIEATNNRVTSFGELARLRRLAKTLQAIALDAEANGNWERGWKIRLAIFRMGNHLIREERHYVDGLVGTAIQTLAMGELPKTEEQRRSLAKSKDRDAQGRILAQVLKDYVAERKPSEGDWVVSQYTAGQEYHRRITASFAQYQGLLYRWQLSELVWYGSESLLAELLALLVIFGILSLPRTARTAEASRAAMIVGRMGAALTIAGILGVGYYAFRAWSHAETTIPAWVTLGLVALLPTLILIFGIILRSAASIRASARYALPVIAIAYVVLSGYLAVERSSFERRALQNIEQGLTPQEVQILKQTGFRR
jgi:hypothetical protein